MSLSSGSFGAKSELYFRRHRHLTMPILPIKNTGYLSSYLCSQFLSINSVCISVYSGFCYCLLSWLPVQMSGERELQSYFLRKGANSSVFSSLSYSSIFLFLHGLGRFCRWEIFTCGMHFGKDLCSIIRRNNGDLGERLQFSFSVKMTP